MLSFAWFLSCHFLLLVSKSTLIIESWSRWFGLILLLFNLICHHRKFGCYLSLSLRTIHLLEWKVPWLRLDLWLWWGFLRKVILFKKCSSISKLSRYLCFWSSLKILLLSSRWWFSILFWLWIFFVFLCHHESLVQLLPLLLGSGSCLSFGSFSKNLLLLHLLDTHLELLCQLASSHHERKRYWPRFLLLLLLLHFRIGFKVAK